MKKYKAGVYYDPHDDKLVLVRDATSWSKIRGCKSEYCYAEENVFYEDQWYGNCPDMIMYWVYLGKL